MTSLTTVQNAALPPMIYRLGEAPDDSGVAHPVPAMDAPDDSGVAHPVPAMDAPDDSGVAHPAPAKE